MHELKIETLKSAVKAIEACRQDGKVGPAAIKAIADAISLNIRPPAIMEGRQPLVCKDVRAVPGSWPHFAQALVNAMTQGLELQKLEAQAKAGDETAKKRHGFLVYILNAVHNALASALRRFEELEEEALAAAKRREARAKSEAERRAREEADAARRARKAERKAAADAILAAAHGATEAPRTIKPGQGDQHPPLTLERVRVLLDKEARKHQRESGVDQAEAQLMACRFVYGLILKDKHDHAPSEIEAMKAEVKAVVASVRMPACRGSAEAQREAEAWAARAEEATKAPRPRTKPERRGQPKPAPNGHIKGANVMEIALVKAGLAPKAANG